MKYKQIGSNWQIFAGIGDTVSTNWASIDRRLSTFTRRLSAFATIWVGRGAEVHRSCTSQNTAKKYKYLSSLAKFGFDTVENEPCKVMSYILTSPRFQKQNAIYLCSKVLILQHVLLNAAVLLRCSLSNTAGIT